MLTSGDFQALHLVGQHARIHLGSDRGNVPGVLFRSGAQPCDYDVSLIAEGGDGSNGGGGLQLDGALAIGGPGGGFKGRGTINAQNGVYDNGVHLLSLIVALTQQVADLQAKVK